MMLWRRKTSITPQASLQAADLAVGQIDDASIDNGTLINQLKANKVHYSDYVRFVFFSALLLIPVYAIVRSALSHDWLMMVIDALFVPVGFVHGVLMLAGVVN